MNHVKTIWEGDYAIQHHWYLDNFGLKRNSFDIIYQKKGGARTYYPFLGKIRANDYNRNTPFGGDDVSPYTEQEYQEMLREQVAKINPPSNLVIVNLIIGMKGILKKDKFHGTKINPGQKK